MKWLWFKLQCFLYGIHAVIIIIRSVISWQLKSICNRWGHEYFRPVTVKSRKSLLVLQTFIINWNKKVLFFPLFFFSFLPTSPCFLPISLVGIIKFNWCTYIPCKYKGNQRKACGFCCSLCNMFIIHCVVWSSSTVWSDSLLM